MPGIRFDSGREVRWAAYNRQLLCVNRASRDYVVVTEPTQLLQLVTMEKNSEETLECSEKDIPMFPYACAGDFIGENEEDHFIYKEFSKLIDFSYSIGKPLYKIKGNDLMNEWERTGRYTENALKEDSIFLALSWHFHVQWIEFLDSQNLTTFDEVFYQVSLPDYEGFGSNIYCGLLRNLNHLMVDEFQDIAPNNIAFLNNLKAKIEANGRPPEVPRTMIVVGDDLQSIYGWRGSSAHYILNFDTCFSLSAGHRSNEVLLENNYRTVNNILKDAYRIALRIPEKRRSGKWYKAKNQSVKDSEVACDFIEPNITRVDVYGRIRELSRVNYERIIANLESLIDSNCYGENNPIYVLLTKRFYLNPKRVPEAAPLYNYIKKHSDKIVVMTIHASKGLEAESVLIVGDIHHPNPHPIRETLYALTKLGGTYIAMQEDESLRLGYVGVTRAKNKMYWYSAAVDPDVNTLSFLF